MALIVREQLVDDSLTRLLCDRCGAKVRASNNSVADYIFPVLSVAFQVFRLDRTASREHVTHLLDRASKFGGLFLNSYVVVVLTEPDAYPLYSDLQLRMGVKPLLLPAFSNDSAVDAMLHIADAHSKATRESERAELAEQLRSCVCLFDAHALLQTLLHVSPAESSALLHSFRSIRGIAMASVSDMVSHGVSSSSAESVFEFFNLDGPIASETDFLRLPHSLPS